MKLSEFSQSLDRMISREEFDLEREVHKAEVIVSLKDPDGTIHLHQWEYEKANEGR